VNVYGVIELQVVLITTMTYPSWVTSLHIRLPAHPDRPPPMQSRRNRGRLFVCIRHPVVVRRRVGRKAADPEISLFMCARTRPPNLGLAPESASCIAMSLPAAHEPPMGEGPLARKAGGIIRWGFIRILCGIIYDAGSSSQHNISIFFNRYKIIVHKNIP
jgi:hypothetical protein